MAELTITEAARQFGVVTNTIRKKVRDGAITPRSRIHGTKTRQYFDFTDLVRVFGEPKLNPDESHSVTNVQGCSGCARLNEELRSIELEFTKKVAQFDVLNQEILGLKARLADKDAHLEDMRRSQTYLLETPKTVFERWFGKKKAP